MAYQSLYRRFRPRNFDQVFGQEHITTTLKNQIVNNNIAHAYLFSGTRGTGKTSTAKIFARAVNCPNSSDGNPCNQCEVCRGITDDSIMDVVEMDAASNNSVEDIRELREKAKYSPAKGRFKVYIIDEVHMLSKGAFNALLKTLEEPPKHLIFILATTEPQKLPATILSRCQRYNFKRITVADIVENMRTICKELNIQIEDRALQLIGRNSDGAMRDALSILDQCISFAEGEISYDYILSILGTVNSDLIFQVSDSILDKELDTVLELIDKIVQNGKDINQFIKDLILHFRNLMIVQSSNNVENIIDGTEEFIAKIREQSKKIYMAEIIRAINVLSEADAQSKWSSQPRIILEVSIIKLVSPVSDLTLEGMANRLDQLEKMIKRDGISVTTSRKDINDEVRVDNRSPNNKSVTKEIKETIVNMTKEPEETYKAKVVVESTSVTLDNIVKAWPDILRKIKGEKISVHALLMEGKLSELKNNVLSISFGEGFGFHKDAVDKKDNKEYIQGILNSYFNSDIEIRFAIATEVIYNGGNKGQQALVDKVIDIFGEEIVEIEK